MKLTQKQKVFIVITSITKKSLVYKLFVFFAKNSDFLLKTSKKLENMEDLRYKPIGIKKKTKIYHKKREFDESQLGIKYDYIPYSKEDYKKINTILKKYITRDLFQKGTLGAKKYKFWRSRPLDCIRHYDEVCGKIGLNHLKKPAATRSVILKILLRIRGENKMEQENQKKELAKRMKVQLPNNFLEEIRARGKALAEEDVAKQELIKSAEKLGWEGLTLNEIDLDLSNIYRKLAKQLDKKDYFSEEDLKVIALMNSMKKDKADLYKFNINTQIKLKDLEEKEKLRQKISKYNVHNVSDEMTLE